MPRPPRLHVPGGCYHVVLRGNHREAIFSRPADRCALNEILAEVIERFSIRVHAFCWMTNHLHLLMQIAERPLGHVMQRIAMRYSRYRHRLLRTTGHLFERRYKARLVDVDAYFLTLVRYIHLNPVKAHIIQDPADYPWSSHRAYLGIDSIAWLTTDFGLSLFSLDLDQARSAYRHFIIEDGEDIDPDNEAHPKDRRILGLDTFINQIPFLPFRPRSSLTLDQLAAQICDQHGIGVDLLRSRSSARALTSIRLQLLHAATELRIATLTDVARFLNRDPSTLSKLAAKHPLKGQ